MHFEPPPQRGLPRALAVVLFATFAAILLAVTGDFIVKGFDVRGSVFGAAGPATGGTNAGSAAAVQGGPPPAVMLQVAQLRARIARHPHDDVALTQLGDLFLASSQFARAIPFYERALAANKANLAAKTGLEQARMGLAEAAKE
ncbi:MAG TPA: hypothetical protein VMV73_00380 [Candidatus Dormibacteraeota bacterium]|nr:hypothetical protein [Candidatus Dormibacteraeota bacterium]